jgi:hypothetical protein
MTLNELRTKADTKLGEFWTALVSKQEAYFTKHGHYFQLETSPGILPVDGADTDFAMIHPHDATFTVDADFLFHTKIPFQIRVRSMARIFN